MKTAYDSRNGHIDALKGAGILLVVFGHLIERPSGQSPLLQTLYVDIYSFHMPLFVFLSGIFAREVLKSRDYQKIVWTLFFPLVVFQCIYIATGRLTAWQSYSPFTPYWLLWFIASLIGWRILLPLFASPIGLAVALGGAVLVGYDDGVGYALSASRTIYFLPFFVLGHLYGLPLVALARRHRPAFFLLFAVTMLAVTLWWWHGLDGSMLTGSHDFASAPPSEDYPALARLLVLALSLAALLGFCALIPAASVPLEWLGKRSLSIYLLHGLAVMLLIGAGAANLVPQALLLPVLAALAVLISSAAALLDGPMRRLFSPPAEASGLVELIVDRRRSR
ncbi:acyltransferase family protein [Manganibacter manganicus]|uniref:Acyltransferase 3 domain-containing protein n=1 Tax=Manganibacter manganicus TaxID=1873176 RepID=A0A1V8RTH8_9HYPH|nr:acyltransferase family protein [Pseudaminobacter manganicus]OQM76339.1 hypothetical protein BFN67_14490 [Pseudaminobacter manganicus]